MIQDKKFFLCFTIFLSLISFLLIILLIALLDFKSHNHIMEVKAEASEFIKPDTASLSFKVAETSKDLNSASGKVNQEINILINKLKPHIPQDKIKTKNFNIYPQYNYLKGKRDFIGFEVSQQIALEFDIKDVNTIINILTQSKIDNLNNLTFFKNDRKGIEERLIKKAIAEAFAKSKVLEKDLNIKFDKVVNFSSYINNNTLPPIAYDKFLSSTTEVSSFPNIPSGENEIKVEVRLHFLVK